MEYKIRPIKKEDKRSIVKFLQNHWKSKKIVSRGKIYQGDELPGFIALKDNQIIGLLTFNIDDNGCEIISLNSEIKKQGLGTALINRLKNYLKTIACQRLWLITTNNNLLAIEFYRKRGFNLVTVYKNSMEKARKLKQQIPLTDENGVPIKDELKFEQILIST